MIKIQSLATAIPPICLNQRDSLKYILKNFQMRPATKKLYEKVFANESIETRHFALHHLDEVMEQNLDQINRRFEREAISLSAESLMKALRRAKLNPKNLDFLAVSTCTGYICPGIAAQLIERCRLRNDLHYVEVVGMGCGSAIPALEQCHNFLRANPKATAASVSTEICSAALYQGDAADLVISNAIFSDGSAAVVLKNSPGGLAQVGHFVSMTYPQWKEDLRFTTENGRLKNQLSKDVPVEAARAVREVVKEICAESKRSMNSVQRWIFHTGGKKVLDEIQKTFDLPDAAMNSSRKILRKHGNLSSPSVLFVLEDVLSSRCVKGEAGMMVSFGAGFSAHGCLLEF